MTQQYLIEVIKNRWNSN